MSIIAMVFVSVSTLTPTSSSAAAPVLSGGIADGTAGVATDATVSLVSDSALAASSLRSATWTGLTAFGAATSAVACADATTCLAAGNSGTVLKTTDGGTTWTAQTSGTVNALNGIATPSASVAFAVGASGTILTTTDGGTTWSAQTSGTANTLNGIDAVSASVVFAVGNSGTILKTTDGGTTWTAQTSGTAQALRDIACASATTCLAAGNSGTVLKTTNGGTTWATQTSNTSKTLRGISCPSASVCFAAGDASVLSRGDASRRIARFGIPVAHAAENEGTVIRTTDGGTTWTDLTTGTTSDLYTVAAFDANTAYAAGTSGALIVTTDGGTTWTAQTLSPASSATLVSSSCLDAARCWFGTGSALYRTTPLLTLHTHTGGTRNGALTGSNACTAAVLTGGTTLTCAHGTLAAGTWYTLTATGGAGGIATTGGEVLATNVTRAFRTAFTTGTATSLTAAEFASAVSEGYIATTGTQTAASAATYGTALTASLAIADGTATVVAPESTVLTRTGGGTMDASALAMSNAVGTVTNTTATVHAAIQYGISGVALTADRALTITIPVAAANGTTLYVLHSSDANFATYDHLTVCTVAAGACSFTTTTLSFFVISDPLGTPGAASASLPDPSAVRATSFSESFVALGWKDPAGSTIAAVRVLRMEGTDTTRSTAVLLGSVASGIEVYRDATVAPHTLYTYTVQAIDAAGNRSPGATVTVTTDAQTPATIAPETLNGATPSSPQATGESAAPLTPKPCVFSDRVRDALDVAFQRSQGRLPQSERDLAFRCALQVDPRTTADLTKEFPEYRSIAAEQLALKNFVNFFRRLPSLDARGVPLSRKAADRDWWAVRSMAYHLLIAPTARDLSGERACLRLFLDRAVALYKHGEKIEKPAGVPPQDAFDYDFIRACTYSGVRFVP